MSERAIVCVLGMHRSGTSLVARLLNLLGADLGPAEHMIPPTSANPAGYWESRGMNEINDEILSRLGGTWLEPPAFADGWERSPELAELRRQARELIDADFSGSELVAFKDPRNCLTLPFWQRIVGRMRYVICLRNPIDVAASLEARDVDAAPFDEGIGLWLTYVRSAIASTAGYRREFMFYEDLMEDPKAGATRLAEFIGRPEPAEVEAAIEAAMSESLWHQRTTVANVTDDARLAFHAKALYLALRQFVTGPDVPGADVIDLFGTYAAEAADHLHAVESELQSSREQIREVGQALSERSGELERVEAAYAEERRLRRRLEAELRAREADEAEPHGSTGKGRVERARYARLVAGVRERAMELIPSGATVLVASKGDDALLELGGSRGRHFPLAADGSYAGYHPAGDTAAIAQLEALRARGADHLVLPATTLWWLDHYEGLRRHLDERYVPLLRDDHCAIYRLSADAQNGAAAIPALKRAVASLRVRTGRDPSVLDWDTGLKLAAELPDLPVFAPPDAGHALPYLDGSVDIVALASAEPARLEEARRVAAAAVVSVDRGVADTARLDWVPGAASDWGEGVRIILLPDSDAPAWEATRSAFAETLDEGFAGELSVAADAGSALAERAAAAIEAGDERVQVIVTAPAVPLPGWLPPILTLLARNGDAGVIGARTVSSSGTLEEAGGLLARGGSPERRGKGDHDPDRPDYCFVRRVDFCSPPLLVTKRDLFQRLGGFERRATAAEAVVDYSLRAGRSGAAVYYQPHARVVALEEEAR